MYRILFCHRWQNSLYVYIYISLLIILLEVWSVSVKYVFNRLKYVFVSPSPKHFSLFVKIDSIRPSSGRFSLLVPQAHPLRTRLAYDPLDSIQTKRRERTWAPPRYPPPTKHLYFISLGPALLQSAHAVVVFVVTIGLRIVAARRWPSRVRWRACSRRMPELKKVRR
jgi:hypothetical protein